MVESESSVLWATFIFYQQDGEIKKVKGKTDDHLALRLFGDNQQLKLIRMNMKEKKNGLKN